MGRRRKKGRRKLPHVVRQLADAPVTAAPFPGLKRRAKELRFLPLHSVTVPDCPFNADYFARSLSAYGANFRVILDTNYFLHPTSDEIWAALFQNRQLVLTPHIVGEVSGWLDNPRGVNEAAHREVVGALHGQGAVRLFDLPDDEAWLRAGAEYYKNLLGVRKQFALKAARDLYQRNGYEPTWREISNLITQWLGPRAAKIAKSGHKAKVPGNILNDEAIVIWTLLSAMLTGIPTLLATHDTDVFDQFYRACYFLTSHWQSLQMARCFAADPGAFGVPRRLHSEEQKQWAARAFLGEEVTLLEWPSDHLMELLPQQRTLVPIDCLLVQGEEEKRANVFRFGLLREMLEIFRIKAENAGRNADCLGKSNLHVRLGSMADVFEQCAVVAIDKTQDMGAVTCSLVDLNLSVRESEPFSTADYPVADPS